MYWPRFKLTPSEEKAGASKYSDPDTGKRGVLRRLYPGQLVLTQTQRYPVFVFQIARRCRVLGLTASGDLAQFKVQIQDSSGESYLTEPINLPALFGGYVELPPPAYGGATAGATGGYPPTVDDVANNLGWAFPMGVPFTACPLIFEPNIVLQSNQALKITGAPMTDYAGVDYRVDFCIHVYEFPKFDNGPA